MFRSLFGSLFALAVLVSSGCQKENSGLATENKPVGTARGTIGVSMLALENPFFKVIGDTIKAEGEAAGYDVVVLDAENNEALQNNHMNDFISQKVAAIVLSPVESRSIVPALKQANAAGIPVITVDIPCFEEGVEILTQIATDNYGGGKEAAQAMIEVFGARGGKIAILDMKNTESCRERVRGFLEVMEKHNAAAENRIEIVGQYESEGKRERGFSAMTDALTADPDLVGVFAINDPAALGARAALEKENKADQVTIIGFDGQPEGKQAIKEGKIYADPIQFPDKMGQQAVAAIVAHSKGEDVPKDQPIPTYLYKQADALKDPDLK